MTSQIKSTAPQLNRTLLDNEPQPKVRETKHWWIIYQAFVKLSPKQQIRNPAMLLVELGALLTTILFIRALLVGNNESPAFIGLVAAWLWLTLVTANFAESLIEGPGGIRAEAWRQRPQNITTKKLSRSACRENYDFVLFKDLRQDDLILVETGEIVPADGEVVEGSAWVDGSLLVGQQTPMLREAGGDWTAIAGGARVLSDWLVVRLRARPDESLLPQLANLLEATKRRPFPHKTHLNMLFAGSVLVVLFFVNTIWFFSVGQGTKPWLSINLTSLVALLLSLMPIISAESWRLINLAEIDQLIRANVIPVSNWAVEIAEKVDLLLLDKRAVVNPNYGQMATSNVPVESESSQILRRHPPASPVEAVPAGQPTVTLPKKRIDADAKSRVDQSLKKRLAQLRRMGVKTVLATADSAHTAAVLAAEAGVDDFLAQATLAARLALIRDFQARGYRVVVAGSRADESPLMRQADLAVAMNDSAYPARETAGMIDLTSNPAQLIKIAEISRQWSTARRAVTFFALSGDIAKYFLIIPTVFASIFPGLETLDFVRLSSPTSAILATIIFNTICISVLTFLARRGIPCRASDTASALNKSSNIYVWGGIVAPFIGIKVIDLLLASLGFV